MQDLNGPSAQSDAVQVVVDRTAVDGDEGGSFETRAIEGGSGEGGSGGSAKERRVTGR